MDLIIKPTQRCNFSCHYCSSTHIAKSNSLSDDLDVKKVIAFLERFPATKNIIVNGGDPLIVSPDFYWEIINYLDLRELNTKILLCTNLWAYYTKPHLWRDLFLNERIDIGTSFDFGGERIVADGRELTLNLFLEIIFKFKEEFDFVPSFVSVLNRKNCDNALKTVELAKDLGVKCKLNYQVMSGSAGEAYPIGLAYKSYLEIYKAGLQAYESNTEDMVNKVRGLDVLTCPSNRECDAGIRNLQPKSKSGYEYGSCGAFGDDQEYGIDFDSEMSGSFYRPLSQSPELSFMKEECLACENFNLCNGCYKTVRDHKKANIVEESCSAMKAFRQESKELGLS